MKFIIKVEFLSPSVFSGGPTTIEYAMEYDSPVHAVRSVRRSLYAIGTIVTILDAQDKPVFGPRMANKHGRLFDEG